jgi:hypothetical protein
VSHPTITINYIAYNTTQNNQEIKPFAELGSAERFFCAPT